MDEYLGAISQKTLETVVVDRLREAILQGYFKPGSQLNQVQIAAQFGTSRGPIRAALTKLEEEGLVRNIPYRGTFVVEMDLKKVKDLYDVRILLEAFSAKLAIENCTPEDIENYIQIIKSMQEAAAQGNTDEVVRFDFTAHQYLIDLSKNSFLQQIWSTLQVQVRLALSIRHHGYPYLQEIADSHLPFIEMMRSKDAEGAAREMEIHIRDARNDLIKRWPADE